MNLNKKFSIVFIALAIFLVSVSAVSAVNNTNDISDTTLSTDMNDISVSASENSINTNEVSNADNNIGKDKNSNTLSISSSDKTNSSVNSLKVEGEDNTFETIQSKIKEATEKSTIDLDPITYYGNGNQINITKPLTINGNGAILDAKGLSKIFYVTADYVTLKNITFINGKTQYFNVYEESDDEYGYYAGAIYWNGNNGTVSNCTFTNCTVYSELWDSKYYCGAIYWYGEYGNVSNCNFNNGGAIYWTGNNSTVSNCTFTNCDSAIEWYGDYGNVNNCTFTNYTGDAILLYVANGNVNNCTFTNCTYRAIYLSGGYGNVNNCTFTNCDSAIDLSGGYGNVNNCTFTNCTANYVIAIDWESANGTVSNCTFTNCTYRAIEWYGDYGNVNNCTFTNCDSAIEWYGDYGNVNNCTFTNCTAKYGGAIYWYYEYGTVNNCTFTNCTAKYGGAIYWESDNGTVSNCTFTNCTATRHGSAIYWESDNGTVSNCTFYFVDGSFNGQTVGDLVVNGILNVNPIDGIDYQKQVKVNDLIRNVTINNHVIISNANFGSLTPGVYEAFLMDDHNNTFVLSNNKYTVEKVKTTTKFINSAGTVYNDNYYKVTLKDTNGKALANKNVIITINGKKYTAKTDKNGIAKVKVKVADKYIDKTLNVKYEFAGDSNYKEVTRFTTIKVVKLSTKITAQKGKIYSGNYYKVTLKDTKGKALTNKKVIITINGKKYTAKTDKNGIAKVKISKKYLGKTLKISYKFAGDSSYNGVTRSTTIKVVRKH